MNNYLIFVFIALIFFVQFQAANTHGQSTDEKKARTSAADIEKTRQTIVENGLRYLERVGQAENGSFTERAGSGITALAITAALRNGKSVDHPMVAKGLKALEEFVKPDGGIYGGGRLKNYETCVAMVAFAEANASGKYDKILSDAKRFVTGLQTGDGSQKRDNPWYGGVGYSGSERPDLSNTAYLIEALRAAGSEETDPAIQRAIAFVSRCQNLKGYGNDTKFADLVNDGGFYYLVPDENGKQKQDSERSTSNGGLVSYGSMTYSGLKSMIYAGLTEKDPRVRAAVKWISNSYSVDSNPSMGSSGLYYYYHTFGSAFNAAGLDTITDQDGKQRNWREDLVLALADRQRSDGSWVNSNGRWFENDPNLSTSFALIALSYCEPTQEEQKQD